LDRLAFAWVEPYGDVFPDFIEQPYNTDLMVLIDDDGEDLHFEDAFNLTQFIQPDSSLLPDTLAADQDTFRVYKDVDLMFDSDNWLHATFTTQIYHHFVNGAHPNASIIWHWSEQFPGEFFIVHNAADNLTNRIYCGAYNRKAQRPCVSQDPETGYFYCVYQVFDTDSSHLSADGWPSGEVYVSVSTDFGQNWSVGINITNTRSPANASPGQCLSELDPSLAKTIHGNLHILYNLDKDAGCWDINEGESTCNEVIYHKVPVDLIPATPLVDQDIPFHVGPVLAVNPQIDQDHPAQLILTCAYPNPFNPTTVISYTLDVANHVTLSVYDVSGREVATLVDGYRSVGPMKSVSTHRICRPVFTSTG